MVFTGGFDADSFQNNAAGFTSITFTGGADNDVFQNNAEGISNINFTGDSGADIFENNGNEVSGIVFTGGADGDIFVNDGIGASNLTFGGGADNDVFINTGGDVSTINFGGGADDDLFVNQASGVSGLSFGGDSDVNLVGGVYVLEPIVSGDSGSDVLINQGANVSNLTFNGGADDDQFWNQSSGINSSNLNFSGDDGADVFINDAAGVNGITFGGGADNDGLQNNGMGVTGINFSGDDGADALINTGEGVSTINFGGGADDDVFVNRADNVSGLNFGGDSEVVLVGGVLQLVPILSGDDGADTLLNEGNHVSGITFTGGADNDVLTNTGDGVSGIDFSGDDGADTLLNVGHDVLDLFFAGGADDDLLQNSGSGVGMIVFEGDDGADALVNSGNGVGSIEFTGDDGADALINKGNSVGSITFEGGADSDSLRNLGNGFGSIDFTGDEGADSLVVSGIGTAGSTVIFDGGADSDLVAWQGSASSVNLDTGAGDDYLLLAGTGQIVMAGGLGNDYYIFQGNPAADVTVIEEDNLDQDTLDFSAASNPLFFGQALNLDLRLTTTQPESPEFSITLNNATGTSLGLGIENVKGTAGADTIQGNARDNIITGAEFHEASTNPLAGDRAETQWVLLDFETYTNQDATTGGPDRGEHEYDQAERDEIQRLLELTYWGPDDPGATNPEPNATDPWFNVRFTQNVAEIPVSDYVTIYFNETPEFGRPGGEASEVDLGNINLDGSAVVQVNGLLGGEVTPQDGESEEGLVDVGQLKPAATSENFVFLSVKIAAHELAHLMGLRHQDSFGPIGTGVHSPPGVAEYNPAYSGPAGGFETFNHLLTTGASVGSDRFNDLRGLYFGEREAVKLAYAFSDQAVVNAGETGVHNSIASAQPLNFAKLAVPNTLRTGLNSAKVFFVDAISILGSIQLDGTTGDSENDFYSFSGTAGELVNIDVSSLALRDNGDSTDGYVDSIIRVYDSSGSLVAYFGKDAINDDEFESSDSSIIDLLLPANDTYYIEVDTFRRLPGDLGYDQAVQLRTELEAKAAASTITPAEELFLERLVDSLEDEDIGNYQLFVYKFGQANPFDDIDALKGNGGTDIIIGGPGDEYDLFLDALGVDVTSVEVFEFSREISFEDRGANTWTGTVNYGENPLLNEALTIAVPAGLTNPAFALNHTYSDNGTFTVTLTVTNDYGITKVQTFEVAVNNVPPTPSIDAISGVLKVGFEIEVTGSATDPGVDDQLDFTYEVFIDGATASAFSGSGVDLGSFSFTPTVSGSYEIRLTVDDGDDSVSVSEFITVLPPIEAFDDEVTTDEDTPIVIQVLDNDTVTGGHSHDCDDANPRIYRR